MKVVREHSAPSLVDARRLLGWQAFNLLAGNWGGHGKNVSRLHRWDRGDTRLAPFCDLVCTRMHPGIDRRLAMETGICCGPPRGVTDDQGPRTTPARACVIDAQALVLDTTGILEAGDFMPINRAFSLLCGFAIFSLPMPSVAETVPSKAGQCVDTAVEEVAFRLEGDPDSGDLIVYTNGVVGISYETVPGLGSSRPGDRIRLCLVSISKACRKHDDGRGRSFKATNLRTGKSWTLPNSQHDCGGA